MLTSILICTKDQYNYVNTILKVVSSESDNVLVIYDDEEKPNANTMFKNVTYVAANKPFSGFGAGWSRDVGISYAIKYLRQDRFVFIDGDCIPTRGSINALNSETSDIIMGTRFDVSYDENRIIQCRTVKPGPILPSDEMCITHSILLSCIFSISENTLRDVISLNLKYLEEARVFPSKFDGVWGGEDSALASAAYFLGKTFTQLSPDDCKVYHQYHDRTHTYTVDGLNAAVEYHNKLKSKLKR